MLPFSLHIMTPPPRVIDGPRGCTFPFNSPSLSVGYRSDRGPGAAAEAVEGAPRAPALSNAQDHGVQAVPGPEAAAADGPRLSGPCAKNQRPLPSSGSPALQPAGPGWSWMETGTSWSRGRSSLSGCCPQPCCPNRVAARGWKRAQESDPGCGKGSSRAHGCSPLFLMSPLSTGVC